MGVFLLNSYLKEYVHLGESACNIWILALVKVSIQKRSIIAVASDDSFVVIMTGDILVECTSIMSPISLFVVVVCFVSIALKGCYILKDDRLFLFQRRLVVYRRRDNDTASI